MNQHWQPGWYPDPQGGPGRRYWDGRQWTHHTEASGGQGGQYPSQPSGQFQPQPPKKSSKTPWIVGAVIAVFAIAAIAGGSTEEEGKDNETKTEQTGSSDKKDEKSGDSGDKEESKEDDCGFKATDDCTPHVGPDGKVRVDALIWRVVSAETAPTIGNMEYGLGEKANGVFVIVKLKVNSTKTESVTLSDDVIGLEAKGNTYKPDTDGTVAAIGAGDEPFFLEEVGPGTTLTGTVVFDVPKKVLGHDPELSFGELGFGSTKAYIALPALSSGT